MEWDSLISQQQDNIVCPICNAIFHHEILSMDISNQVDNISYLLRNQYTLEERIEPLVYCIIVCPDCYYSSLENDFAEIQDKTNLKEQTTRRQHLKNTMYPNLSFNEPRSLEHGLLSYLLASECYQAKNKHPISKSICNIRAYWLATDLFQLSNKQNTQYNIIQQLLLQKTIQNYFHTFNYMQKTKTDSIKQLTGPDITNHGHIGFLYLLSYFSYAKAISITDNPERQKNIFLKGQLILSKLLPKLNDEMNTNPMIVEKIKKLNYSFTEKLSQ